MNELKNYIINEIKEHLQEYKGTKTYFCDLAYTIFEGENIDCTYTYSTQKAIEWVQKYFEDIGEIIEELKFNFGAENIPNVFDETEKFQVVVIIEGARYLLGQYPTVDKYWNEETELTQYKINKICKELDTLNYGYDFYTTYPKEA